MMKIEESKVKNWIITNIYSEDEHKHISITKWANGEGWDFDIAGKLISLHMDDINTLITLLTLKKQISIGQILIDVEEYEELNSLPKSSGIQI